MNNKIHTAMYSIGLSSIVLALAFMIWSNNNDNNAMAQQSSQGMSPNRQYSMSMSSGLQNQNWTGSISLFSPILDAFKSKIHTTLNNATTSALTAVGGGSNSSAVAAFIHPENGFLVYDVFVLDSSNNVHKVMVDPGNGRILSNQQMSMMDMMFMMHHGMGMMGHSMMMGGGQGPGMGMMGHSPDMMMDHGMGMMGGPQASGEWP
jgi:uncharacterized membrane protein YkoI